MTVATVIGPMRDWVWKAFLPAGTVLTLSAWLLARYRNSPWQKDIRWMFMAFSGITAILVTTAILKELTVTPGVLPEFTGHPPRELLWYTFWIGVVALSVGLGALSFVVFQNSNSKILVLTGSALVGAAVIFGFQLYFELWVGVKELTSSTNVSTVVWVDQDQGRIRSPCDQARGKGKADRGVAESFTAGSFTRDPERLRHVKDPQKLAIDFVMYSLLNFLGTQEFDWRGYYIAYGSVWWSVGRRTNSRDAL